MNSKDYVKKRNTCRGCSGNKLELFLDLGNMPLAGGFLKKHDIPKEQKFPLRVYFCRDCGLVQILDVVNPEILFKKYFYVSSVIKNLNAHFAEYYKFLKKNYLNCQDTSLLEFGSNDGVLLKYFLNDPNTIAVGVDPSENVSEMARRAGCTTVSGYFDTKIVPEIYKKFGKFDVITGSNVFAHTDDIGGILMATDLLLKEDGHFIVEVHYLPELLEKFQFDTIYHEHLSYYSLSALKKIFFRYGFRLVDAIYLDMHGGAIRAIAVKVSSSEKETARLKKFLQKEKGITLEYIKKFQNKVETQRFKLLEHLKSIKKERKSVVGYGAAGRGTILLNYCGIDFKILDYIVDVSPLRIGMLMPGVHIPIYSLEKLRKKPSDYVLVIAWNYFDSILDQEEDLVERGVKFIKPLPEVSIV